MNSRKTSLDQFLEMSVGLTGFTRAELEGTGMAELYFDIVGRIIDSEIVGTLLLSFEQELSESGRTSTVACEALAEDQKLGPVIKNITTLWYLGQWNQMPRDWRNVHGATAMDRDHVVSEEAYRQGLAWVAMGAHPMGTKQQGYGAWSLAPTHPQ